jgi:hypothetical protein
MPTDLSTATLLAMSDEDIPSGWRAALIVLSAPTLQSHPKVVRFVDFETGFDWQTALRTGADQERWSHGELSLVMIASALWGQNPCELREMLKLDDKNLRRALLAIEVHRSWRSFRDALTEVAATDSQ